MLSAKTQYACLAMAQLASDHAAGTPIRAARIAEQHGIPPTFLVQILHELKRAGLVSSTRGAGGGYQLSASPDQINVAHVVEVVEPAAAAEPCAANHSPLAPALEQLCGELAATRHDRLAEISLAHLAEGLAVDRAPMWYI